MSAEYSTAADLDNLVTFPGAVADDEAWPEPMPLVRPLPEPLPYPVDALGFTLAAAAQGITSIVQCPLAIAASSVLATASLAAQAHVDVVHPATGRAVPTSLFVFSIAESGERKSAADAEALAAVVRREAALSESYKSEYSAYKNAHEAWEVARAAVKRNAKGDRHAIEAALAEIGEEPRPPRKPQIVTSEPTTEGLQRLFGEGQPSLGLFSAEGGGMVGGHAMQAETRLRALTALSELWDGSPIRRTRSGDGSVLLPGRRLALHLMVQPAIAPLLLGDQLALSQGFCSRLLVCAPVSTQGTRFQREPEPWARPSITRYHEAISALLAKEPRLAGGDGLDPMRLALTDSAVTRWRAFADEMEAALAGDGITSAIRGLRNKTPEMVLRIAGVLATVDGEPEIKAETLERGIALAEFYLSEARRLYEGAGISPEVTRAVKLLRWLLDRGGGSISLRDIQREGPGFLREAQAVKETVGTLEAHGLCRVLRVATGGRHRQLVVLSPYADTVI